MMITEQELIERMVRSIKKTINKFREQPHYFFTESDIVSYLWMALYSSRLEVGKAREDRKRIYLAHREYPTNFKYEKKKLQSGYSPDGQHGSRGHYDFVLLNPKFAAENSVENVVFKNYGNLQQELSLGNESVGVLIALEFKYVINGSKSFCEQIRKDSHKLRIGRERSGIKHAANLVFCNCSYNNKLLDIKRAIKDSFKEKVPAFFIQAYYDHKGKKTPKTYPLDPDEILQQYWHCN